MRSRVFLCLPAVALLAASVLPAQDQPGPPIPTDEDRAVLRNEGHRPPFPDGPGMQENIDLGDFDVLHYDIDLTVDPTVPRIDGVVLMQAESLTDGLASVVLDLYDNMEIFSLLSGGLDAVYTRGNNQLNIELDRLYDTGEMFQIEIAYGGRPTVTGLGSFRFNTHGANEDPIISTLSEPFGGRTWWPSRDVPWDKVTTTMDLTVPEELTGISNGTLLEIVPGTGTRTFRWEESYPIASYLVSIAVSNYVTWTETYTGLQGEQMPVSYWVYPEHENRGREAFNVTVPMIEFFANLWGEYPFIDEKYDQAEFPCWCAMEHQTATTYGHNLIRSDHRYDFVVAHELAHQWWGDLVTLATWEDIWLNEGFASYSEALWFENVGGFGTYTNYMRGMDRNFAGSVYQPDEYFNSTVYNKGAWVLHMLRKVMGEANLYQMFRDWATSYAYDNASTDDLRVLAESLHGADLTWFWDQWIYEPGRPNYRWGWLVNECNGEHTVYTQVRQIQGNRLYDAPLDIRLSHGSGPTTNTEWNTDAFTEYYYVMNEPVTNVQFDPDYWVLKYSRREILPDPDLDGIIDDYDGCPDSWNPCQVDSDGDGIQDACDPDLDDDNDGTNNEEDCSDNDPFVTAPPDGEVRYLYVTKTPGDPYGIDWEAFDPGNQAEITYDVIRGRLSDLHNDGGSTQDAVCLSRMNPQLSTTDGDDPPNNNAHYYLVRPRNSCAGGPYGPPALKGARFTRACQ